MSQYRIHDPEECLECPYDKTHMVRAKRMQYHLMKCRKNYTGTAYEKCPFNAKHHIPKPEYRHHLSTCEDRAIVEHEMGYMASKENGDNILKGCTDTPVYQDIIIPTEDDWEAEASEHPVRVGPAFDTNYYDRVKFKDLSGMTKSQKAAMNDNRLTVQQKMEVLGGGVKELRLPTTPSQAAEPPKPQPIRQPVHHSVYAYSIAQNGGEDQATNAPAGPVEPVLPMGRGRGRGALLAVGRGMPAGGGAMPAVGRGMPAAAVGRGHVAPPPGFCVPNINRTQN